MEKATVYLSTPLFSHGGPEAHVPPGTLAIDGTVEQHGAGALTIRAERFRDERGRELREGRALLMIPWDKIDHVVLREGR